MGLPLSQPQRRDGRTQRRGPGAAAAAAAAAARRGYEGAFKRASCSSGQIAASRKTRKQGQARRGRSGKGRQAAR
ncbi:hypothetical protein CPAR01_01431 [Colletotrichum paranaense]|uniref:Uncharacterized protein n=1 Tax=Colletotrichum paranaense TaxID=1914294 RepID=A0ABQ9T7J0_9PEZI|nr:uncharacterized protein CPAR01_01431 [Colletotrichum paranaense]KAK1547464.1 hypothetical protein CPAR01_01431 [Colletotrichum paranaense]